jgi:hypothetical protein
MNTVNDKAYDFDTVQNNGHKEMPISEIGHTTHHSHYSENNKCNYFAINIRIYAVNICITFNLAPKG